MPESIEKIILRAVSHRNVRANGSLTIPRSYGVYQLPRNAGATRRFRFGNHPVRMRELEHEFKSCSLVHLFSSRDDAMAVAMALNDRMA